MNYRVFARFTPLLLAAIAVSACHKTGTMNTAPSPSSTSPQMIAMGDSIFHARSCRNCHGMDAKGSRGGPDLTSGKFTHVNGSYDDFVRIITSGVPADSIKDPSHRNPMPARGGARPALLTDDQIHDVAAYVYSLNHK